jgi:carboxyl-terminal processing protease
MENEHKVKVLTCILAVVIVLSGTFGFLLYKENQSLENELLNNADLIELESYVDKNFYKSPDRKVAMDGALKGYVAGLGDPYSSYLTEDEYKSWQTMESGTMVGIGVTVQQHETGLYVVEVTEGYPAYVSGIHKGDIIIEVEGEKVTDIGYDETVARIKGEEGTEVTISVDRNGERQEFTVMRSEIEMVTASGKMLDENIGYIRISAFRENTDEQFAEIFDSLLSEGAKGLIFDVRNNGGGLLTSLQAILDPLLPEGNIAIATYGNGDVRTIVQSDAEETNIPMAVLVNGNTASAAELFAASLSDWDKAFLVGETTFGKGIMQSTESAAGGAITLTVATYQTVRGECYHGVGITPDYEVTPVEDYEPDFQEPDASEDAQLRIAWKNLLKAV